MNQIETKRILSLDPTIKKADFDSYDFQLQKARFFGKYFPKYLPNFDLQTKTNSIKAKVKRAKIFRSYKDYTTPPFYTPLELRLLLKSKAKFIKTLGSDSEYSTNLTEKMKLFDNLRTIQLSLRRRPYYTCQKIEVKNLVKALGKTKHLKNVKSLELNQLLNSSTPFIQAINASPRIISSFKSFAISNDDAHDYNHIILKTLKDCKSLLRKTIFLRLPALCSSLQLKHFQSLENSCPNLKSLCFEFSCRDIFGDSVKSGGDRYSRECFPVEINYLNAIKTFGSLRSLSLHIADTFTFINDFQAPPSLQNLLLNFKESLTKEILIRIDPSFNNQSNHQVLEFFETNPTLLKFYSAFEHLYELQTLEMLFSSHITPEEYQYYNYLSQAVLQSIPSTKLKKLQFAEGSFHWGLDKLNRSALGEFYLLQLLKSCHTFRQSLETLEIGHTGVVYSNFKMLSFLNNFPNLSTFIFNGSFDKKDRSNSGICLLLKQVMTSGTSLKTLQLNTFLQGTVPSLISLLHQLNQLEKPANLKIKLQMKFYDEKNLKVLTATHFEHYKRVLLGDQLEYSKLKGVDLNIFINETIYYGKEFLKVYGQKFDNFKIFPASHNFQSFNKNY